MRGIGIKMAQVLSVGVVAGGIALSLTVPSVHAAPSTVQLGITDKGFSPDQITAVVDVPLRIHVVNRGSKTHQLSIPYYRIYTSNLKPGASNDVEFTPWQAGRFDITSDPSGSNQPEFTGKLVVKAAP